MSMPLNKEGVDVTIRSKWRPGMKVSLRGFEDTYEPGTVLFSMGGSNVLVVFPGPGKKNGVGWYNSLMLIPPEDLSPVIEKPKKSKKIHVFPT
jgi:hypothetical protein